MIEGVVSPHRIILLFCLDTDEPTTLEGAILTLRAAAEERAGKCSF